VFITEPGNGRAAAGRIPESPGIGVSNYTGGTKVGRQVPEKTAQTLPPQ